MLKQIAEVGLMVQRASDNGGGNSSCISPQSLNCLALLSRWQGRQ